jgi:hypothetical protein
MRSSSLADHAFCASWSSSLAERRARRRRLVLPVAAVGLVAGRLRRVVAGCHARALLRLAEDRHRVLEVLGGLEPQVAAVVVGVLALLAPVAGDRRGIGDAVLGLVVDVGSAAAWFSLPSQVR